MIRAVTMAAVAVAVAAAQHVQAHAPVARALAAEVVAVTATIPVAEPVLAVARYVLCPAATTVQALVTPRQHVSPPDGKTLIFLWR